jgi:hypothetical protein
MTGKTSFKVPAYTLLTIVIVVLWPVRTLGWGNRGHQVVARIAMARLSPSARQAIDELLEPGETLETVSTWADQIKTQRVKTKSWHFVPIPLSATRYSRTRDCARSDTCIIEAIGQQITILKDPSSERPVQAEALKFLVNLIGDLHQPFRVTTNTNPPDRSASSVRVTSLTGRSTSLLDVWDNDLVEYGLKQSAKSVGDYAGQLSKKFSRSRASKNQSSSISTQGSVTDWALEAHKLPWGAYYHTNGDFMVADPLRSWNLDQAYYDKNVTVVELQVARAGARLARILNDIFSTDVDQKADYLRK